ncbi:MAG: CoA transferase [Chloroflexi bacterium]|nr:CoA transferase [Chloroflexota bacterium]
MADLALADVTVLDLGTDVPGPFCAKLLADYGAEVIKIEPPARGDPARRVGPFPNDLPHPEQSGLFLHLNTNKWGITLDSSTPSGRAVLLRLARQADIVIENFSPGTLERWRLGFEDLAAVNPRIILTSISPFGQTGPYREYQATEIIAFAMSTRMYLHGQPDREPLRYAPDVGWFQTGATAATATLGALFTSRHHGVGQHVDVAAVECLVGNVDARTLAYAYTGQPGQRGSQPLGYPNGAYPAQDGFLPFAAGSDRFFRRLCRVIGHPELLDDPRWATPAQRQYHQDEFEALFLPWLLERTRQEVFAACQAGGVMMGPILNVGEVHQDPQMLARRYFVEIDHPAAGTLTYPGAPFMMTETPWRLRRPAPLLGQHNEEVYCGRLGYSRQDLLRLRAHGVM